MYQQTRTSSSQLEVALVVAVVAVLAVLAVAAVVAVVDVVDAVDVEVLVDAVSDLKLTKFKVSR